MSAKERLQPRVVLQAVEQARLHRRRVVEQARLGGQEGGQIGPVIEVHARLRGKALRGGHRRLTVGAQLLCARVKRQAGHADDQEPEGQGQCGQSPRPALLVALPEVVEPAAEDRRSQLELGHAFEPALALAVNRTDVGCERLHLVDRRLGGNGRADLAQGPGEGFVRLAFDQEGQDLVAAAQLAELEHFLIDPSRVRRPRRADDDEKGRLDERLLDRLTESMRRGQLLFIAEHAGDAAGNAASAQRLRNPIRLQLAVQPLRPRPIGLDVAVADERAVAEVGKRHREPSGHECEIEDERRQRQHSSRRNTEHHSTEAHRARGLRNAGAVMLGGEADQNREYPESDQHDDGIRDRGEHRLQSGPAVVLRLEKGQESVAER